MILVAGQGQVVLSDLSRVCGDDPVQFNLDLIVCLFVPRMRG